MNRYIMTQTARFAFPEEIMHNLTPIDLEKVSDSLGGGGIPLVIEGKTVYADESDTNNLIFADPGSGKTRRIACPLVMTLACKGTSMVINDPKGEIIQMTREYLEKMSYSIKVLNFKDPMYCDTYNPLYLAARLYVEGDKDSAKEMFNQLGETLYASVQSDQDPFWATMAVNLFQAYCMLACYIASIGEISVEDVSLSYIYQLFLEGEQKLFGNCCLKEYLCSVKDEMVCTAFAGYIDAATETKASILSVFSSVLSKVVTNTNISDMISGNSIDIEKLVDEKTAIFIIQRDEAGVYNALMAAIIDQFYLRLIQEAERNSGVLFRKWDFVIDEFSNLWQIPYMENKISECRSRGIRWHLFVQSLDQIEGKYHEKASVITACCQNMFYMHTPEYKLLDMISKRCGDYVTEYTHERRPLLSTTDLQYFNKNEGETLVLLSRQHPYVISLLDISIYMKRLGLFVKKCDIEKREKRKLPLFSMSSKIMVTRKERINQLFPDYLE